MPTSTLRELACSQHIKDPSGNNTKTDHGSRHALQGLGDCLLCTVERLHGSCPHSTLLYESQHTQPHRKSSQPPRRPWPVVGQGSGEKPVGLRSIQEEHEVPQNFQELILGFPGSPPGPAYAGFADETTHHGCRSSTLPGRQ